MSRIEKLKEQHPQLNITLIDIIAKIDPTKTYKYCEFFIKTLNEAISSDDLIKAIGEALVHRDKLDVIKKFESHCAGSRIKNSDISTYKSFNELQKAVYDADETLKLKELEKQVIKLYDSEEWVVVIPQTFEASQAYGSSTKWCTTNRTSWDSYSLTYKLFYIINRKTNEKYAISQNFNVEHKIQAWASDDIEISPLLIPIPDEVMSLIINEIKKKTKVDLKEKNISKKEMTKVDYSEDDMERMIREYRNIQKIPRSFSDNKLQQMRPSIQEQILPLKHDYFQQQEQQIDHFTSREIKSVNKNPYNF